MVRPAHGPLARCLDAVHLAKLHFHGRDKIFLLVMAILMVPSTVTLVPLFVFMSPLGLVISLPGAHLAVCRWLLRRVPDV